MVPTSSGVATLEPSLAYILPSILRETNWGEPGPTGALALPSASVTCHATDGPPIIGPPDQVWLPQIVPPDHADGPPVRLNSYSTILFVHTFNI